MSLSFLDNNPPWDWPDDAKETVLKGLRDEKSLDERILAARLAGDPCVVDDQIAEALLDMVTNDSLSDKLRSQAAFSLGPALELALDEDFEETDPSSPISEEIFDKVKGELRKAFLDAAVSKTVRRSILEVSVRAPDEWHRKAVKDAYATGDQEWRLTAAFAMRWISGFDTEVLESLKDSDPTIRYHAVCAAGNWELDAAWPDVLNLATSRDTEKRLLIAAIEAAFSIRPNEAAPLLVHLAEHEDEDIGVIIHECMATANPELERCLEQEDEEAEGKLKKYLKELENF